MTFRTWSIIAKPGNMSYEGMMHTYKMRRLCNNIFTKWLMFLISWYIEGYVFEQNRILATIRRINDRTINSLSTKKERSKSKTT